MPCKDTCQDAGELKSTLSNTHHSDNNEEACSPFCICACCGQSYTSIYYTSNLISNTTPSSEKIAATAPSFISEVYLSIWQPPKLS